jgi:hypothetical protein
MRLPDAAACADSLFDLSPDPVTRAAGRIAAAAAWV